MSENTSNLASTSRWQDSGQDGRISEQVDDSKKKPPPSFKSWLKSKGLASKFKGLSSKKKRKVTITDDTSPTGSPWVRTVRRKVEIKDLDLDKSYEQQAKAYTEPSFKPQKRQKRWRNESNTPIRTVEELPHDWNAREPDLDPNDIDAQILRCEERIADGIMPHLFETRLADYKRRKDYLSGVARKERTDLETNSYKRIDTLEMILAARKADGDKYGQIDNIQAILKAYRSKSLSWTEGLVTYWAKGKKLCEPRPFDWDEFEAINSANGGHKSFWVEGVLGPSPLVQRPTLCLPQSHDKWTYTYRVAVRLPFYHWWTELEFLYDTGSSTMTMYEGDLQALQGPGLGGPQPPIPILGDGIQVTANGLATRTYFELEATVLDSTGKRMTRWTPIFCALEPGFQPPNVGASRSDGPFLRYLLFTSTLPDGRYDMIASTRKNATLMSPYLPAELRQGPYAVPPDPPIWYPTLRTVPLEENYKVVGFAPPTGIGGSVLQPAKGRNIPE